MAQDITEPEDVEKYIEDADAELIKDTEPESLID